MSSPEILSTVAVRERPILFSAPMVRTILSGEKTQTRRIVKSQPSISNSSDAAWRDNSSHLWRNARQYARDCCPYGKPGDQFWVRETWAPLGEHAVIHQATNIGYPVARWKPSIHMPRWASRITLEITDVRVERLQDISAADAKAEGISVLPLQDESDPSAWYQSAPGIHQERTARASFSALWDSIYSEEHPWAKNPWVWVIGFRKL